MRDKIRFIKPYLKDIIIFIILIFLALIIYDKPSMKIRDVPKGEPSNNLSNLSKYDKTEETQTTEDDSSVIKKTLSIFKEESINEESKIKQPTFEEVLFGEGYENIKLIAITGTEKNKKALVLDHMNNLRTFRKGEKIDNKIIVVDISNTSVKFKSENKVRELSLYKREFIKTTNAQRQTPVIRQQQKPDEIIQDEEIEEEPVEKMRRPRREIIR